MALIIEDGSVVVGANSYITEAELNTYISARGYSISDTLEPLIIRSYDYMLSLTWVDRHDIAFTVSSNIKNAQCEIAYRLSLGLDPSAKPDQSIKREKVGSLETEYFSGNQGFNGSKFLEYIPQAKAWLNGLIVLSPDYLDRA